MKARWLHTLQQFQFSIVHRAGRDHSSADGLSRVSAFPCGQCTHVDCPRVDTTVEVVDQPFDAYSVGDSEDADLVSIQSLEKNGWLNLMMTCPDRPLDLGKSFVSVPYNVKIPRASRCRNGSGRMLFFLE